MLLADIPLSFDFLSKFLKTVSILQRPRLESFVQKISAKKGGNLASSFHCGLLICLDPTKSTNNVKTLVDVARMITEDNQKS